MKIPFDVSFYGFSDDDDSYKLCLSTTIEIDEEIVFSSSFTSLHPLALQLLNADYDKELSYYNIETVWFDCALDSVLYSQGICVTWNIDKQEYEVL